MKGFPFTLCVLCITPCGGAVKAADAAPLSLKTSGAVAGLSVRIAQGDSYSVRIDYYYPPADLAARKTLWEGAGGVQDNGAPFNVNLRIYDVDDAVVIQDRRISHPTLSSWGDGVLHAELSEVHLPRGRYQITVERRGSAGAIADYRAGVSLVKSW
ncbi:hypothetical protein PMM47T1_27279 [Pseudomonas sp. M47T1]|uniref:DUF5625 family protein n=1 Tax=unclassified Pseudomonas TaxID=196821 RepID=UPI0002608110|nr:DUF5625 family protein [Pseudomonas sp. M47T1]EIK93374.1 hypothetical protein PMM47T1_27279 [Pseudomonas sp. M47T1]